MKKVFFVIVFILLASALFAQRTALDTSDGVYYVAIQYKGKFIGQEEYNNNVVAAKMTIELGWQTSITENIKLSNGQLEAVNKMLNRYNSSKGDSYYISIGIGQNLFSFINVFVEFTSNTRYNFWAYRTWK